MEKGLILMSTKLRVGLGGGITLVLSIALCMTLAGCSKEDRDQSAASSSARPVVRNAGSDSMVNLAQAWAEEYGTKVPSVSVEVSGGGSGSGIAALIHGTADIANTTRRMSPEEIEAVKRSAGKNPQEYLVGYDALAIYVHGDNPIEQITMEQLAEIYGEGGKIDGWSQLGTRVRGCPTDQIIRVGRQSSSGTYHYLREILLGGGRDFKLGSRELNGCKDIVELVAMTPCAIGYSAMRYATGNVKKLKLARTADAPGCEPSAQTVLSGAYPIPQPLYMVTIGPPKGETKKYLQWVYSDDAQKIVHSSGYIPLPQTERVKGKAALTRAE
jgi:phosphate transport system substrate-binding protein